MLIKVLLNILGTIFLVMGILGIFLPLLPTTPFLLLASACYVRGSSTLHNWLLHNKYLGSYITNIKDKRAMPIKAKILTLAFLWPSLVFSMFRLDSLLLDFILLMVGIGVTTVVLKLKTIKTHQS